MSPDVPNSTFSTKQRDALDAAFAVLKSALYPVGCIYFSTNSTNPATSLGFGTWSAFGAGRVPVGFSSGETEFDTDEETGGAKTVTLDLTMIPSHAHVVDATQASNTTTGGAGNRVTTLAAPGAGTQQASTSSVGGGAAHDNLQPYIVVRMWKRTA